MTVKKIKNLSDGGYKRMYLINQRLYETALRNLDEDDHHELSHLNNHLEPGQDLLGTEMINRGEKNLDVKTNINVNSTTKPIEPTASLNETGNINTSTPLHRNNKGIHYGTPMISKPYSSSFLFDDSLFNRSGGGSGRDGRVPPSPIDQAGNNIGPVSQGNLKCHICGRGYIYYARYASHMRTLHPNAQIMPNPLAEANKALNKSRMRKKVVTPHPMKTRSTKGAAAAIPSTPQTPFSGYSPAANVLRVPKKLKFNVIGEDAEKKRRRRRMRG